MVITLSAFTKEERLKDLSEAVQHCNLCSRMCHRTKVLSGYNGNINSKVLFVAEAPGRLGADKTGVPLFGDKTGDNFERLLGNIGWKREGVFITNAILCNPRKENGNNATPTFEEIKNCSRYLEMIINLVQPEVVVSLGVIALNALGLIVPHYLELKKNVGCPIDWNGMKLIPLYHPGPRALIHRSLTKQRADFISVAKLVDPIRGIIRKDKTKKQNVRKEKSVLTTLHRVVFEIVQHFGQITYFKLTKLLYLIDLLSLENTSHTITGEIYLRQQEGPWPPALRNVISFFKGHEIHYSYKNKIPIVAVGSSPRFDLSMDEKTLRIIVQILEDYGSMDNSRIKYVVYRTKPMRYLLCQEKKGKNMTNAAIIYKDKTIIDLDKDKTKK